MDKFSEWITVKTFNLSHESFVIKSFLESEGIECFLKDNITVQIDPFYSNSLGGVKLQVKEYDYDKAIQILLDHGHLKPPDFEESKGILFFMKIYDRIKRLFKGS